MEEVKPNRKRKRRRKSASRYFRELFTKHPKWLELKSNKLVQAQYEKDHPGKKMTKNVRANMANIKSVMRKEMRDGGRKGSDTDSAIGDLDGLEVAINACLSAARGFDPNGLESVIKALRRARYELVLKIGEPE